MRERAKQRAAMSGYFVGLRRGPRVLTLLSRKGACLRFCLLELDYDKNLSTNTLRIGTGPSAQVRPQWEALQSSRNMSHLDCSHGLELHQSSHIHVHNSNRQIIFNASSITLRNQNYTNQNSCVANMRLNLISCSSKVTEQLAGWTRRSPGFDVTDWNLQASYLPGCDTSASQRRID